MELKDIFPASKIFDPDIYYEGEVHLGDTLYIDNSNELTLNALMIKNKNAFLTFLEKNYYTYMRGIFNSESWDLKFSVVLRLGYNKQTDKRSIRFSLLNYLIEKMNLNVIEGVNYDHFNYAIYELNDDEELLECAREISRESRRRLQDILKNKYNSPYIKNIITDIMSRNEDYHNFNVIKKYAERGIEIFTEFLVISKRYLLPFFNKELDYEEFLKCFSYDKICLIIMYEYLDTLKNDDNLSIGMLKVVKDYVEAVKKIRENHAYNSTAIINLWGTKKNKVISVNDILANYDQILKDHPNMIIPNINSDKIKEILKNFGYSDEEIKNFNPKLKKDAKTLFELLDRMKEEQLLFAKWEFFPKGEKKVIERTDSYVFKMHTLEIDELIRRLRIARNYIEGTNYFKVTEGLDTFSGYLAYIYPNGKVIFMRDYTKAKTKLELESSATYIMNLKDFIKLSKLSKPELISLINRAPEYGIKRIYNYEDMNRTISRIESYLAGDDYTEEVKLFIKRLIESGKLTRKR